MSDISFFVPTGPYNINELSKEFSTYNDKILIKELNHQTSLIKKVAIIKRT